MKDFINAKQAYETSMKKRNDADILERALKQCNDTIKSNAEDGYFNCIVSCPVSLASEGDIAMEILDYLEWEGYNARFITDRDISINWYGELIK